MRNYVSRYSIKVVFDLTVTINYFTNNNNWHFFSGFGSAARRQAGAERRQAALGRALSERQRACARGPRGVVGPRQRHFIRKLFSVLTLIEKPSIYKFWENGRKPGKISRQNFHFSILWKFWNDRKKVWIHCTSKNYSENSGRRSRFFCSSALVDRE